MTERKNVTLKAPFDQMFKDLKARGEFDRSFGSFSEFVQAMIEDFHDDPDRVRAEYHKKKVERHQKLRQNYEQLSESDLDEESDELEEKEEEFFNEFYQLLKKKKGGRKWHNDKAQVYKNLENGWIRKYQKDFGTIREKEFREKLEKYVDEDKLQELEILETLEV